MVYTKHFTIHTMDHLNQSKEYVQKASKTMIDKTSSGNTHYEQLFPYIMNADKTLSKQLVSGHGITDVTNAANEFLYTKERFAKQKGTYLMFDSETETMFFDKAAIEKGNGRGKAVLGHHLVQSFSPEDDLTPEEIHEIGRQTVLEFTGGEHEFVIATHVDRKHIHNHIIINSTNLFTGKALPWKVVTFENGETKDYTKELFEKVSDKISSKYGAKIIEKSPKNSHKKYTKWQTESIYKSKIKSRLDFLLLHSSSIEDFKRKAEALELHVDFSGKWAKYRLLDEPQIKSTRSRSLNKKNPEKYNLKKIEERLKENTVSFSIEEVVDRYEEKINVAKNDFDYQLIVEPWQISHKTPKGYYVNVDFGIENHGQIFIGAFKVDELEDGNYSLFVKRNDTFYFMNEKNSAENKYMTGYNLMKQLSLYNGTVPLKKEPVMSTINEIVDAINFLAEHGVTEGNQMERLEKQLVEAFKTAEESLTTLDDKILQLNQVGKLLLANKLEEYEGNLPILNQLVEKEELTYDDVKDELASLKLSRKLLQEKMETTVEKINELHSVQTIVERKTKEENLGKIEK
ncbi:transcription elongation factor GreAB [Enterococcus faecalis]|nr:transcription elongation factor GreAB [Enterococcus faecalis]